MLFVVQCAEWLSYAVLQELANLKSQNLDFFPLDGNWRLEPFLWAFQWANTKEGRWAEGSEGKPPRQGDSEDQEQGWQEARWK